jgi:hypothetical protein
LTLLNPIWLFALAAIGIPVVIHLWNIKPGKTLKVGSISLFSESSPKSSRSFKLLDILLLLLRCLLLTLLAFLLATPLWQQHLKAGKARGWILIPKENFNQTYRRYKTTVDSFQKAGYEFHYFNQGFAKADLNAVLQHPGKDSTSTSNYWDLVKELAHQLPATVPAALFTPNTIEHFTVDKPTSALKLNWHTYTPADSVNTWLAGAWLTPTGNIRVVQGTAIPTGTNYQYTEVKNGGQTGSPYQVSLDNGLPVVTFNQSKLTVDTATQHIAIYAGKNTIDAGYLKAGLDAVAQFTLRKTIIKVYNQTDAIPGNQNWIFWLSEQPAGDAIVQKTKNLFSYAVGKATEVNSWLNNSGDYVTQGQAKISLTKIISAKPTGNTLWTDGLGNPVLSLLQSAQANNYQFYSHFNPAWNDLVWNDAFPKWLMALTYPDLANHIPDRRMLSAEQIQPVTTTGTDTITTERTNHINLTNYLWLILVLTFFTERWLATKNKTELANG